MITTKRNKQHGSKSTNYNPRTRPFEPAEESTCFPRDPLLSDGSEERKR